MIVTINARSWVGPSPRRPTASGSLAVERRGDTIERIDRHSYSYYFVYLVPLLYHVGSAPLEFYFDLIKKVNIVLHEKSERFLCGDGARLILFLLV